MLDGTLGLEKNAAAEELAEDATDAPHVDGRRVMLGSHQDLGCSVVLRDHLLSHVFAGVLFLDSEMFNESFKKH